MISKSTIRRWNKKFHDATKADKRVLIAKDVIQQIEAGMYKPTSVYVNVNTRLDGDLDFQSNSDKVKCECCGVGACLISLIRFTNNATIEEVDYSFHRKLSNRLEECFSVKQLALIELMFEQSIIKFCGEVKTNLGGNWRSTFSEKEALKLNESKKLYKDSKKKRLIQIMENIVRNNGTFKPHQG